MNNLFVKKVIAKEGSREIVDSSFEEKTRLVETLTCPDFNDDNVICIKFLISDSEDITDAEETCWYINPVYEDKLQISLEIPTVYEDCYPTYIFYSNEDQALRMPSNVLPELILMFIDTLDENIFDKYAEFEGELMSENKYDNTSDLQKYTLFQEYLNE